MQIIKMYLNVKPFPEAQPQQGVCLEELHVPSTDGTTSKIEGVSTFTWTELQLVYVSVAVWKLLISEVTVSQSVAVGKSCSTGGLSLLELRPVGFPDRKQRTKTCLDCVPISFCKFIYSRHRAFSDLFLPYLT